MSGLEGSEAFPERRRPLVSGNWKMHMTHLEAINAVQKLSYRLDRVQRGNVEVSIHPPFTSIRSVQTVIEADELDLEVGAQNVYYEAKGAFTGEVSPVMLAKLSVRYVIVGHSERRQIFGETDREVNLKAKAVLANQMTPIVCVGETDEQRSAGETLEVVRAQLGAGLEGLDPAQVGSAVLAYEPLWAIGTGKNATPGDAQEVCSEIRRVIGESWGDAAAGAVRIQYGGSVKPKNAEAIMAERDIDGLLVGGASLDPDDFAPIVAAAR